MADDLGSVRRTPRPTPHPRSAGDRQTPETVAQSGAGTTNEASPVSGDHQDVSSRVSSQGEPAFQAATLAVLEAFNPVGPDDVEPNRSTEFAAYVAEQVEQALIGAGWRRPRPDREAALADLRTKLAEDPESILFAGPECDMEAYAALPPCTACEGGGQDTHGTVFEAPLAVHFAAPEVEIAGRRRQLCLWCGHVLIDVPLADGQTAWPPWPKASLVRVEDGTATLQPYTYGDPLPPGCCALPDDDQYTRTASSGPTAQGIPDETESTVDSCTCSPDRCDRLTVNGQCQHCARLGPGQGSCPAEPWCDEHGHPARSCTYCDTTGEIDESGPDEAQETRAAADWPAEETQP